MKTIYADDVESVELDPDGSHFRAVLIQHRPMGLPPLRTVVVIKRCGGMHGLEKTYSAIKESVVERPAPENITDFQRVTAARFGHR